MDSPPAEVEISEELVAELVGQQHPDLAHHGVQFLSEGWDNKQFRLGSELVVRLPRREAAVQLITHEQRWLAVLAPKLPLAVPVPLRIGLPSAAFSWPWSICGWIPGRDAIADPLVGASGAAVQLAEFLNALHQPAPSNAPKNDHRGGPLVDRDERTRSNAASALTSGQITREEHAKLTMIWDFAVELPADPERPTWLHGDLHPGNIAVEAGTIMGILDWGDITSGDPACDLGILWALFSKKDRDEALARLERDAGTVSRGRGWALSIGVLLMVNSQDRPSYMALGRRYLDELLADL